MIQIFIIPNKYFNIHHRVLHFHDISIWSKNVGTLFYKFSLTKEKCKVCITFCTNAVIHRDF